MTSTDSVRPAAARTAPAARPLRLVHYYPRAGTGDGGVSSAVRGWAAATAGAGAAVTIISDGQGEPATAGPVRWVGTGHRHWGGFRTPVGLDQLLADQDALVLHSGWVAHNLAAARAAARAGIPYLLTPHGAYEPNVFRRRRAIKQAWWWTFERALVSRARAVHVFFDEQAREMRELGYTGPVIVAPNGLAVPAFSTPARRADHVLWMGRFDVETKGLDLLLEALATLPPAARPRLRLHGPDWRGGRQQTLALARSLGLEKSVTVGAPLYGDDKWAALRECGLFVFPSRWDAQSVMLLEAAAAGAPLLATNTTPFGRYLEERQAAVVVEATPQALAAGLQRGGSPAAASLGAAAAELARTTFSWPAAAESYVRQVTALL